MQWNELLQEVNARHQTTFALGKRYEAGEQGAFVIVDQKGRRGVLKWTPDSKAIDKLEQARAVTARLRERGYPAPRYLYVDEALSGTYSIQHAIEGSPIPLDEIAEYIPHLLKLNALQVGQALPGLPDWHREVVNTVLFGGDGYCLHSSLQHYTPATATLLTDLQQIVSVHRDAPHRTHDIVHSDFQHANILVHNSQIVGVVDWDAVHAGDCAFDIATLLFYSNDDHTVCEQLWHSALERANIELLSVYLAHLILRQVDWSLRHHDQSTIDHYLNRSNKILAALTMRLKHL
jgi:aminoglycoside phosphotransferase